MIVWVLDREGYDARGGNARVFASAEAAKRAAPWVKEWEQTDNDGWEEKRPAGDVMDIEVIYWCEVEQ